MTFTTISSVCYWNPQIVSPQILFCCTNNFNYWSIDISFKYVQCISHKMYIPVSHDNYINCFILPIFVEGEVNLSSCWADKGKTNQEIWRNWKETTSRRGKPLSNQAFDAVECCTLFSRVLRFRIMTLWPVALLQACSVVWASFWCQWLWSFAVKICQNLITSFCPVNNWLLFFLCILSWMSLMLIGIVLVWVIWWHTCHVTWISLKLKKTRILCQKTR